MAASTRRHRDQSVDTGLDRLFGVPQVDHIVKHQPAIIMHRADKFRHRAKRGDDERHLVADDHVELVLKRIIAAMHDEIGPERRGRVAGFGLDGGPALADLGQPFVKAFDRSPVLHRKTADDAGTATGQDQFRSRGKKHRRGDQRQPEAPVEDRG